MNYKKKYEKIGLRLASPVDRIYGKSKQKYGKLHTSSRDINLKNASLALKGYLWSELQS